MLRVCYDLKRNPPTYDFVTFLLQAERERLRRGETNIEIDINPGPNRGFRQDRLWPQDPAVRRALLNDIVVPMAWLLPSVSRVSVHQTRLPPSGSFGEDCCSIPFKRFVDCVRDGIRPLRLRQGVGRKQDRLVSITLRECEHWPERNSNLAQWIAAAHEIIACGFGVVFVRDTARAEETLAEFPINAEAAHDLNARAALYRSTFCNLFVSNGPAWFAVALDAPVLLFKPTTEQLGRCYSSQYMAECGLNKDDQFPPKQDCQKIVWEDDSAHIIAREFRQFAMSHMVAA